MTKSEAQEILKSPKFGDPACLFALETLGAEAEALRDVLCGAPIACMACDGRADNCKVCEPDGTYRLTRKDVDGWDLDQLKSAMEEADPHWREALTTLGKRGIER